MAKGDHDRKRYLIERDIPNVGRLTRAQLKDLAATSNSVLYRMGGKVQWVHSYIAADKTFCIYLAESELLVREHSRLAGFPITKITEVPTVIDPMTGFSYRAGCREGGLTARRLRRQRALGMVNDSSTMWEHD